MRRRRRERRTWTPNTQETSGQLSDPVCPPTRSTATRQGHHLTARGFCGNAGPAGITNTCTKLLLNFVAAGWPHRLCNTCFQHSLPPFLLDSHSRPVCLLQPSTTADLCVCYSRQPQPTCVSATVNLCVCYSHQPQPTWVSARAVNHSRPVCLLQPTCVSATAKLCVCYNRQPQPTCVSATVNLCVCYSHQPQPTWVSARAVNHSRPVCLLQPTCVSATAKLCVCYNRQPQTTCVSATVNLCVCYSHQQHVACVFGGRSCRRKLALATKSGATISYRLAP